MLKVVVQITNAASDCLKVCTLLVVELKMKNVRVPQGFSRRKMTANQVV